MTDSIEKVQVLIVGAGLSGLCCARALQREGVDAHIFEASDDIGGRVRTDEVDGFILDRGFQVLFTAYPILQSELNLKELDLQPFDSGALVLWRGASYPVADPFREPKKLISAITTGVFSLQDKLALFRLRRQILAMDLTDIFLIPDQNIHDFLVDNGFTGKFINNFAQPFYGGIFLSRHLDTSARMFAFTFKMLLEGQAAVPARGMMEIPRQIARDIQPGTIHLNMEVESLIRQGGEVKGVQFTDGRQVFADEVVLTVPSSLAAKLTGMQLPLDRRSTITAYFEVPVDFNHERSIMLFPEPNKYAGANSLVNSAVMMSRISADYAPAGKHLLSVSIIGEPRISDSQILEVCCREIGGHFPESKPKEWKLVKVYRIPWAQFTQPAGIFGRLPRADSGIPGLVMGGEILCHSSIQGALESGQLSAKEVLMRVGKLPRDGRRPRRTEKLQKPA
jgi:protoporphyrinogen oxidase